MLDFIKNSGKGKTNVADTSIECFHQIKKEGQIQREKELVLNTISLHQPITSRELSYRTGKERANCTRSLFDLEKAGSIKIAFTKKCKTTNKRVRYYTLIDWRAENGN